MAKKKLEFSPGFPFSFLLQTYSVLLPLITSIILFEVMLQEQTPDFAVNLLRGAYALIGWVYFRKVTPQWQMKNGEKTGDRAILRGTSTSLLLVGGLLLYYSFEDLVG